MSWLLLHACCCLWLRPGTLHGAYLSLSREVDHDKVLGATAGQATATYVTNRDRDEHRDRDTGMA
jgi:hypothetical protein